MSLLCMPVIPYSSRHCHLEISNLWIAEGQVCAPLCINFENHELEVPLQRNDSFDQEDYY